MTFEDFVAGFTDDTGPGWSVEPREGTIERRGGAPQRFTVKYSGLGAPASPTPGTLVIVLPNDNFSWTYKFQVREGEKGRGRAGEREGKKRVPDVCAYVCGVNSKGGRAIRRRFRGRELCLAPPA